MKKRSIIGSTLGAAVRFTRGVVAVGTLGISELGIAGVKKVGNLFKRKEDEEDFDYDDFEEEFEDELEEVVGSVVETVESFCEVEEQPTAEEMQQAAKNWEEPVQVAPTTPVEPQPVAQATETQ